MMDVIADIGSYPQWVSEYKETEVLESDSAGYPKTARLLLDAAVLRDNMVLTYDWPADRSRCAGRWCRARCCGRSKAHTPCGPRDPAPRSPTSCRWT